MFFTAATGNAQFKLPVHLGIRGDLQKVVAEYPTNFQGIRGDLVDRNPQSSEFVSRLKVGDARHCSIISYSTGTRPVYSWQALMFVSEDFEAAAKKYKALFQQVKGANLYYLKDQYTLKGKMEEADESRGFSVSTLLLDAPPTAYEKLRIDVSLQFEFPEWKVMLLVYEKEREDDEQGREMDE